MLGQNYGGKSVRGPGPVRYLCANAEHTRSLLTNFLGAALQRNHHLMASYFSISGSLTLGGFPFNYLLLESSQDGKNLNMSLSLPSC